MADVNLRPVDLVRALADPSRMDVLDALMGGEATVSELLARTGASQSNLSNHLAVLRRHGIVRASRAGRSRVYAIADPKYAEVLEAVYAASAPLPRDVEGARAGEAPAPIALARTCYDHLAGRLGVRLFDALVEREAIVPVGVARASRARKVRAGLGDVALGPAAREVFATLGIDLAEAARRKRQFATACNDWTESRPHLGGALGAAVWERLRALRWILRAPGTRVVSVTPLGRRKLEERFGIDL